MFKHILLPVDGSVVSNKAAKAGVALASALGARITIYHAIEEAQPMYDARFHKDLEMNTELQRRAFQQGQEYVAFVEKLAKKAGVRCTSQVRKAAAPYQGITDAAKRHKCDAIFIGSHGRSGLSRVLLGSVTQKVLAQAQCPVVVYR